MTTNEIDPKGSIETIQEQTTTVVADTRKQADNIIKYWTVMDGVLGTAHTSRKGEQVDFRPASARLSHNLKNRKIVVLPPRGQDLDELVLEPTVEKFVEQKDSPRPGMQVVNKVLTAHYMGAVITLNDDGNHEWYDEDARIAFDREETEQRRQAKADYEERGNKRRDFLASCRPDEMIAEATSSDIAKLRAGTATAAQVYAKILIRKATENGIDDSDSFYPNQYIRKEVNRLTADGTIERFGAMLLEYDDRRREEKKQEWLTKKNQK